MVSISRRTHAASAIGLANTRPNSRGLASAHIRNSTVEATSRPAGSSSGSASAAAANLSVAALSISKATRSTSSW